MKKLFILVALLLTVTFSNMKSDNMTCLPDCPNDQFNFNCPVFTTTFGNCTMRIYWGYRFACGQYHDIIITGIDYWGDCSLLSERDMLDFAALFIMRSDFVKDPYPAGLGWEWPNEPNECVTNWRVNKWSCWRQRGEITFGYDRIVACNNDPLVPCCLTWYKICLDNLGREIITIEDEAAPPEACPTEQGWLPCMKVCDPDGRN
ncbi:MAG: hypothetical protein RO257_16645 [Candidatus Kapabacteria bacterium]|nr:hypothetical protein [Candidatus Kapabacteria bacterium]